MLVDMNRPCLALSAAAWLLYALSLTARAEPIAISGPIAAGGSVNVPSISADGLWVAFGGEKDTAGFYELYSVPSDGRSAPVKTVLVDRNSGGGTSASDDVPSADADEAYDDGRPRIVQRIAACRSRHVWAGTGLPLNAIPG